MNVLTVDDLSVSDIIQIIEDAQYPYDSNYPTKRVGMVFVEPSTRTKLSFIAAAQDLSMKILDFPGERSSMIKGESEYDTVANMIALGSCDVIVMRDQDRSALDELALDYPDVHFINAGTGQDAHPTQALGDLLVLGEQFFGLQNLHGKTITILGNSEHSRVARSNYRLLTKFGMNVQFGGYAPMVIKDIPDAHICESLEEAVDTSDVLMALRAQQERNCWIPSDPWKIEEWQINQATLEAKPELVIMHPGPVIWGSEISEEVKHMPQMKILRQAGAGYQVRKALLDFVLSST